MIHWLALRMTPGLGTRKAGQLIEIFRTPQAIFRASRSELEGAGLSPPWRRASPAAARLTTPPTSGRKWSKPAPS